VVPVYNERANIPPLYEEIEAVFDGGLAGYSHEVIWVEDGSDDGTAQLIDHMAANADHVRAIHLARNWGQSAALAAGFDESAGRIIVPMDGDLQNDPADIPALVAGIEDGADCVSGNRAERDDPWHKTIPSAVQTRLAKLTGPDIDDFGCTLTAYRAGALSDIDLYGEEHRYIPAQLHDRGYEITQLEVNHRPREHGESRYGVGRLVRGFVDLLFHWFWVRYSSKPMHIVGAPALALLGGGMLLGGHMAVLRLAFGEPLAPHLPRLVLVALLVLSGLLLLTLGVLAEMLTVLLYRDEREYRIERVVE